MSKTDEVLEIRVDKSQRIWWGDYRGIRWVIKCTDTDSKYNRNGEAWTFYLGFFLEPVPLEDLKLFSLDPEPKNKWGRTYYRYNESPLASLPWHGGCTFYEKQYSGEGELFAVQFGCDYSHLGDERFAYSVEWLLSDVRECVDAAIEMFPYLEKKAVPNE